jgi:hypothetical protein
MNSFRDTMEEGGIVQGGILPKITSHEQVMIPDDISHEEYMEIFRMKLEGGTLITPHFVSREVFEIFKSGNFKIVLNASGTCIPCDINGIPNTCDDQKSS